MSISEKNPSKAVPAQQRPKRPPDVPFPLGLRAEVGERFLCGQLSSAGEFRAVVKVPCELGMDALRYAACRLFVKSPGLQKFALPHCLKRRFGKCSPKVLRACVSVPASFFELSDAKAFVQFAMRADGVCVERVWLLPSWAEEPRNLRIKFLRLESVDPNGAHGGGH